MADLLGVVSDLDVVEVSGPAAADYLQGQISQDIDTVGSDQLSWSFVLQPSGKVESWFRILRLDETAFVLYVEPGFGATLTERLRRFLIRTAASVEMSEPTRMLSLRGDGSSSFDVAGGGSGLRKFTVDWPEFIGVDLIGHADEIEAAASEMRVGSPDSLLFEGARIAGGVPMLGSDITVGSIPAEAGDAVVDASVSFTKGCYTGQELVARMKSRGSQAPRRLRRLSAQSDIHVDSDVTIDGDVVGVVRSASGRVGLASLMRKVSPGDRVEVLGVSAAVADLPGDALS